MVPYIFVIVPLLAWGGHLAWRWKQARDFAPEVLTAKQSAGEIPDDVDVAEFTDLYLRSEGPRGATYVFVCAAAAALLLAPFVGVFNGVWRTVWTLSGENPVFAIGTLIHSFSVFLAFMFAAIGLLALAMHRYYSLMPPSLRQMIRDLNGDQG